MGVGDPEHNDEDDEKQRKKNEEKHHVALPLARQVAVTRGGGGAQANLPDILFHPPDGRLGALDGVGRSIAVTMELFRQPFSLLGEQALLFRQ